MFEELLVEAQAVQHIFATNTFIWREGDNAVGKAGIKLKNGCSCDIGSDGDAQGSLGPQLALGQTSLGVGCLVSSDPITCIRYIAGLNERIRPTNQMVGITWSVFRDASIQYSKILKGQRVETFRVFRRMPKHFGKALFRQFVDDCFCMLTKVSDRLSLPQHFDNSLLFEDRRERDGDSIKRIGR
jgi:hypothetical protein